MPLRTDQHNFVGTMYVTVSSSDLLTHLAFFFGGILQLHMLSLPDHAFTPSDTWFTEATLEATCILPQILCYMCTIGTC